MHVIELAAVSACSVTRSIRFLHSGSSPPHPHANHSGSGPVASGHRPTEVCVCSWETAAARRISCNERFSNFRIYAASQHAERLWQTEHPWGHAFSSGAKGLRARKHLPLHTCDAADPSILLSLPTQLARLTQLPRHLNGRDVKTASLATRRRPTASDGRCE